MKIEPLGKRVLLKPWNEGEKVTKSGILLSEDLSSKDIQFGEIVSVGDEVSEKLKVDTRVIFSLAISDKMDDKLYIVREEDLLAIIKD